MPTAISQPQKGLRANAFAPSGIPDTAMFDFAVLTLDDLGVIRKGSQACEPLFGYLPEALVGQHISILLPQLPDTGLVQEDRINSRLAHLCRCATAFQAKRRDGRCFASELFINRLGSHNVVVLVRGIETAIPNDRAMAAIAFR